MRLSRLFPAAALLALAALLPAPPAARADDTEDFLKPDNWEGRSDLWKIDAKAKTVVGETTEDPKYNTFFCSKKKYGDFEMTCKIQLRDGVGNSGIQIRSVLKDDKKFVVHGPQVDVGAGYFGACTARASAATCSSRRRTWPRRRSSTTTRSWPRATTSPSR